MGLLRLCVALRCFFWQKQSTAQMLQKVVRQIMAGGLVQVVRPPRSGWHGGVNCGKSLAAIAMSMSFDLGTLLPSR